MKSKYNPNDLYSRLERIIGIGLKATLLSPSEGSDRFKSFIIDDIMDEIYKIDMLKYGGRNVYRRRLKNNEAKDQKIT
jgi:hypothetical protein